MTLKEDALSANPRSSRAVSVATVPDSTAPARYFPGWTMLGIAAVAQYMSAPGQSYSVAAFKDPMREGLGLNETNYSLAYGLATVISAILLPPTGRLVDRFGARVMLPLIAVGLGAACLGMSQINSLLGLYIGFSFVRSLGQGALSLISVWLVGEWFQRQRGRATAIAGLGGGLSVMTVPLFNNWLIRHAGWEQAWIVMGLAVWVALVIPSLLWVRDRPELLGLLPDGDAPLTSSATGSSEEDSGASAAVADDSWSVREVLADRTFWKLLSVPATAGLVGTGLVFHQVALLGSHGLPSGWALGMLSLQAGVAMAMIFPAGWATDRYASRYILCLAMLVLAAATLLAMTMPAMWCAGIYACLLGIHGSVMRSTATVVWINYYGRKHQGAVRGVAWSVMILASALGPLPLALSIDVFHSYAPALAVFMAMPLLAAGAVWSAYPPQRRHES